MPLVEMKRARADDRSNGDDKRKDNRKKGERQVNETFDLMECSLSIFLGKSSSNHIGLSV